MSEAVSEAAPQTGNTMSARCGECGIDWVVAYLPMDLHRVAELAKLARCPRGCIGKVYLA